MTDVLIEEGRVDVLASVLAGRCRFEWASIVREHAGHKLIVSVFADAMKFDGVPELDWSGRVIESSPAIYDGVRLPCSAEQLQKVADHLDAMLMTPVIIEELWLQADVRIDAIVNDGSPSWTRVADLNITHVAQLIEKALAKQSGYPHAGKLVSCVGKYWCLVQGLGVWESRALFGERTACNFGWCSSEGSGPGVTPRVRCWQRPGYKHPLTHHDPSQLIRLMSRHATIVYPDGQRRQVTIDEVAADPMLAPLIHHDAGPLTVLRQPSVTKQPMAGTISLPEVTIEGTPPPKAQGVA